MLSHLPLFAVTVVVDLVAVEIALVAALTLCVPLGRLSLLFWWY